MEKHGSDWENVETCVSGGQQESSLPSAAIASTLYPDNKEFDLFWNCWNSRRVSPIVDKTSCLLLLSPPNLKKRSILEGGTWMLCPVRDPRYMDVTWREDSEIPRSVLTFQNSIISNKSGMVPLLHSTLKHSQVFWCWHFSHETYTQTTRSLCLHWIGGRNSYPGVPGDLQKVMAVAVAISRWAGYSVEEKSPAPG
eukprot:2131413-Rhodomonas_salina.1